MFTAIYICNNYLARIESPDSPHIFAYSHKENHLQFELTENCYTFFSGSLKWSKGVIWDRNPLSTFKVDFGRGPIEDSFSCSILNLLLNGNYDK
jgi:hypothetical protein